MGRYARVSLALAVALGLGSLVSIASPFDAVPAAGASVSLSVTPTSSLMDEALSISVRGLKPKASVVLRVTSTDVNGVAFASEATFRANSDSVVNPGRMAPVVGSYEGVHAMGLTDAMSPVSGGQGGLYFWGDAPQSFTFTASSRGQESAPVTIERSIESSGVERRPVSVSEAGFVGRLYQPPPGTAKKPAVLEIGGSGGGLAGGLVGGLLASHGYPTLDLAYFKLPDLPATLSNISLEYFTQALTWLGSQPNVDPRQIYVLGTSRGSEAALLLGAHFPDLVAGVIASVPSNVVLCSPSCDSPAWTLNGEPLPYTRQFNNPAPTDVPDAVIPVERIRGPILLVCGGTDLVWHSCDYARAIRDRLAARDVTRPHPLLTYPSAGHGVGLLVRYEPSVGSASSVSGSALNFSGATVGANAAGLAKVWPRVLAFLDKRGRG
jgi:dienelactone hydrolase